jgi:signal peptidase II
MPTRFGHWIFLLTTLGFLALDLWSKHAAFERIRPGEMYVVWQDVFALRLTLNSGMMWGRFQDIPAVWWVMLRGGVFGALIWLYLSLRDSSKLVQLAFGLVAAGALGNIWDNVFQGVATGKGLFNGSVRDFLHFYAFEFPTFNVADSCICVGAPLLLLILWSHDRRRAQAQTSVEGATT